MLVLSLCRTTVSVKYSKKENQRYHVIVYCEHLEIAEEIILRCVFFGAELCKVNCMVVSTFWGWLGIFICLWICDGYNTNSVCRIGQMNPVKNLFVGDMIWWYCLKCQLNWHGVAASLQLTGHFLVTWLVPSCSSWSCIWIISVNDVIVPTSSNPIKSGPAMLILQVKAEQQV